MFLKRFGLKDFKALAGYHKFDFKPITILIGKNSSGKSSLTKAMLILSENYQKTGKFDEINFSGSGFSMGDFNSVLNNETKDKCIEFVLPLELDYVKDKFNLHLLYSLGKTATGEKAKLNCICVEDSKGILIFSGFYNIDSPDKIINAIRTYLPEILYNGYFDSEREFITTLKRFKSVCYHNAEYFLIHLNNEIMGMKTKFTPLDSSDLPGRLLSPEEIEDLFSADQDYSSFELFECDSNPEVVHEDELKSFDADSDLIKFYKAKMVAIGEGISIQKVDYTTELPASQTSKYAKDNDLIFKQKIYISDNQKEILDTIKFQLKADEVCETLANLYSHESVHAELAPKAKFVVEDMYNKNLKKAITKAFDSIKKISYLSPYRGVTKRIYFSDSGDSQFAEMLDKFCSQKITDKESSFLNHWLKKFEAGEKITVERYQGAATSILIEKRGKIHLLADLGYGYHQVIPILIQIIINSRDSKNESSMFPITCEGNIIIVEEPESNLHPNLQSMLADLFVDAASKFNIQFILETHSEYLVRKIQYLVSKNNIDANNVNIYYFSDPNKKTAGENNQIYEIKILKNGMLSKDFGPGFLDEADNLAIDLFNLNKIRNN